MKLNHLFKCLIGQIDTEEDRLISVVHQKYGKVNLCLKVDGGNVPIAQIVLHSRDRYVDAMEVMDDAYLLGQEIARRWNTYEDPQQLRSMADSEKVDIKRAAGRMASAVREAFNQYGEVPEIRALYESIQTDVDEYRGLENWKGES